MKLDQHFLIDEEVIKKIILEARIKESDIVVEIGPGTGNITKCIPKCNLILIERDEELIEELKEKFKGIKIIYGNALDYINKLKFDVLVSGLPYSISEPLTRELILLDFKRAILVLPKNFVESIKENKTAFGFVANAFLDIEIISPVKKQSFKPLPNIDSYIVRITKKEKLTEKEKIIQGIYKQQDKKLKNALREFFTRRGMTKNEAKEKIKKMNLSGKALNKNVKNIELKDWQYIINFVTSLG